jgi:hypothetical protein
MDKRTELQREVVQALVESRAINFDAFGGILAKYAERAALNGDALGLIVNWRIIDGCIPPDPWDVQQVGAFRGEGE